MLWRGLGDGGAGGYGARARRALERWLEGALRSRVSLPRIPVRRVDAGGFDRLMSTERGRRAAVVWWERALERVPLDWS